MPARDAMRAIGTHHFCSRANGYPQGGYTPTGVPHDCDDERRWPALESAWQEPDLATLGVSYLACFEPVLPIDKAYSTLQCAEVR